MRGTRLTLSVNNLFDQRQNVIYTSTGAVPLAFQPAYIDATGRTIKLSFRKLFF